MTLDEIKQTPLFKANAPLVAKAFGEQYVEEFARELERVPEEMLIFGFEETRLGDAFWWNGTPQGYEAWDRFLFAIEQVKP